MAIAFLTATSAFANECPSICTVEEEETFPTDSDAFVPRRLGFVIKLNGEQFRPYVYDEKSVAIAKAKSYEAKKICVYIE
ncbi:MAG: hypothetical protein JNL01_03130 [Bdellovibrionales bacterium]|nr:hypothetical protein [Bdellovibrionales bacterium]